jgi:tetratricopeptide (TPR) repeat protein
LGHYRQAIEVFKEAVAAFEGASIPQALDPSTLPRSIMSENWLVWCLAEIGAFPEGIARGETLIRMATETDHPFVLINTSFGLSGLYLCKGDLARVIPMLERCVGLSHVWNIPVPFPILASQLGLAYALSGRIAEALALLEQAVERAASMAVFWCQALRVAWLGEAHLLAGRREEAGVLARRAVELARAHKEQGNEAYALRLLGGIAATHDVPAEADAYYRQALALATELGMRPLVAHCHLGLGALFGKVGQQDPARAELSTAIELYRSMEMVFWLPKAEAALAAVEGR